MDGIGGMWYRAAEYETQEQCMEFLGRLKPALAERPNKKDDLLTISFGAPEGKNYVIALGFPTPETKQLTESLFERPAVTLSNRDLAYARQEVSKLRRNAGMSDELAGALAGEQLQNMGVPGPFVQSIKEDYTHSLATDHQAREGAEDATGEAPDTPPIGSAVYPVSLKDIPPEIRGQVAKARAEALRKQKQDARPFFVRYRSYINDISLEDVFDIHIAIYKELLRLLTPYLFTDSAMQLFRAVHESEKYELPIPDSPLWIEFTTPIQMPYGFVKALCVYNMRTHEAIEQLKKKYPKLGDIDKLRIPHESLYRVEGIDEDMKLRVVETFDVETRQWVYTPQHHCPTGECTKYEGRGYGSGQDSNIAVQPCQLCQEHTAFWAAWTRTALLMIDREYATTPDPKPWQAQAISYEEEGTQRVGKGKNQRTIKVTRQREIEYRIITFDVSLPEPKRERSTEEETSEERRANWLTIHDKGDLIYKRMHFKDIQREYTGPHFRNLIERCTASGGHFIEEGREYVLSHLADGTPVVTSSIVEFDKYVPMLREKTPTIKKAVASQIPTDQP